jgi:VIT1/CCC1 family predicted Fe2+/Mn2+ transporter
VTVGGSTSRGRVLDPLERQSEILFGLIMVLTFTCTISASQAGKEEVRDVLIGALGCNVAWGIIDAVMYLMAVLMERGRGLAIARAVRASPDPAAGRRLIADALPEPLDDLIEGSALEDLRAKVAAQGGSDRKPRLNGRDLIGALGVFLLVFLSTFPPVIPFLVLSPVQRAMRTSNAVAIVLLFVIGHRFGKHAGIGPMRTGFAMVAIGLMLVAITIAMGG